jgi:VWFA-related protein
MPLSTMLLLDMSESVVGGKLDHLRAAAHAFVDELEGKDEAGLLTFTREMQLQTDPGSDFTSLHRSLEQPMVHGETGLHDTLYAGLKIVEARVGRPLVVLFTDGLDNSSWLTEAELLDVLKASDAVVYTIGVEPRPEVALRSSGRTFRRRAELPARQLLGSISRATGGRIWYVDSNTNIKDIFLRILIEMRNRYLLSYQPQGVGLDGWHDLEVRLKEHQVDEIRSRPGYLVGPRR